MNMKPLNTILLAIDKTDDFTQSSVLGGCFYVATAAAVNAAMRIIDRAEPGEASGIDGYAQWMEGVLALKADEAANLRTLGAVAELFGTAGLDVMMEAPSVETHLAFRINRGFPKIEDSQRAYRDARTQGQRFTVSMKDWVDQHYAQQLEAHTKLVRFQDEIVRLIQRVMRDELSPEAEVPEWLIEALRDKAVSKLYGRREKLVQRSFNPRHAQAALTDMLLIDAALTKLDEHPAPITFVDEDGNPESYMKVEKKGKRLELVETKSVAA